MKEWRGLDGGRVFFFLLSTTCGTLVGDTQDWHPVRSWEWRDVALAATEHSAAVLQALPMDGWRDSTWSATPVRNGANAGLRLSGDQPANSRNRPFRAPAIYPPAHTSFSVASTYLRRWRNPSVLFCPLVWCIMFLTTTCCDIGR